MKFDLILRSEMTIDRIPEAVWPHFLDFGRWMIDVRLEPIAGRAGEEGERRLVAPSDASPYNSYVIETVRVTPSLQYVVKVAPEAGDSYFGLADWSFTQTNGRTHLIYTIYIELTLPQMTAAEFQQFSDEQYAVTREQVAKNNRRLQLLVEAESSARTRN